MSIIVSKSSLSVASSATDWINAATWLDKMALKACTLLVVDSRDAHNFCSDSNSKDTLMQPADFEQWAYRRCKGDFHCGTACSFGVGDKTGDGVCGREWSGESGLILWLLFIVSGSVVVGERLGVLRSDNSPESSLELSIFLSGVTCTGEVVDSFVFSLILLMILDVAVVAALIRGGSLFSIIQLS